MKSRFGSGRGEEREQATACMSYALKAKQAGEFSVLCPGEEGGAMKIKLGCLQNLLPRCPLLQLQ
eukprot:3719528-Rhodomonas_salina.1